jgi:hypothetical protein
LIFLTHLIEGLGPILPQMVVFGRQLGVSPTVMGFFLSMLPFLYFFAKPLIGMLADYFSVSQSTSTMTREF